MTTRFSRRAFLGSTAAGLILLSDSRSARTYAANEKINLALVGVGGRGSWFVGAVPKMGPNIVALCDVNEVKAAGAFKAFPDAKKYFDFRKMLGEMEKQIDAAIIATPDNTHAVIAMAMIKAGKHVFVEKPLAHDIFEIRSLRTEARARKVATQMGNQGTASESFRRCVELIQGGAIGDVKEVYVWNESGGADKKEAPKPEQGKPAPVCPDTLHWDFWLGPAADRPYHPFWLGWNQWRELGTGMLGNWATHSASCAFKALKIDSFWNSSPADANRPTIKVTAQSTGINKLSFPKWEIIRYDIPARGEMPPVQIRWSNGSRSPMRGEIEEQLGRKLDWGDNFEKKWKDYAGSLIIGSKGKIHLTGHNMSHTLFPEEKFKDFEGPAKALPRSHGHEIEWFEACRGGPAAMSNFDYSGPLTEFLMLGNIATQFEGPVEYDPAGMKITNVPEANALMKREYRKGWEL